VRRTAVDDEAIALVGLQRGNDIAEHHVKDVLGKRVVEKQHERRIRQLVLRGVGFDDFKIAAFLPIGFEACDVARGAGDQFLRKLHADNL